MHTTRREFIHTSMVAGSVLALGGSAAMAGLSGGVRVKKLKLLILGGTGFLGPHTVRAAIARGHEITLFHRGKTEKQTGHMFEELEHLHGNRDPEKRANEKDPESAKGLSLLEGRKWDAVIDTSGYYPRIVKASAELLAPNTGFYVFISSVSAYASHEEVGMTEDAPVGTIEDPTVETMGKQYQNYGPLKALCEQAAEAAMPGRVCNIRPGLIVGPGDPTDRFTYWPVRVSEGGEVLCPGTPADPIQIIDARDLGDWIIHCIEHRAAGVYNAVGPASSLAMGELVETCKKVSESDARFTWGDADFLEEQKISAWGHMPAWVPPRGEMAGFTRVSNARGLKAGLKFRPVEETVAGTLEWWNGLSEERRASPRDAQRPKWLTKEREGEVLELLRG